MHLNPAAPVLALPDLGIQVGWDRPLILEDVAEPQARFLRSLEGGRQLGSAERRRFATLLRQLSAHGLLIDDLEDDLVTRCVRIHGAGALGTEAAIAVARMGVALTVVDKARARSESAAHLPDADCGAAAHVRVKEAVPLAQLRGTHASAGLDVLISAGPAVGRARSLLAANQPHLLVECGDRAVRVGPLVVPGVTACATCLGLAASEDRPVWPVLALQCDSRRPRTTPIQATIAGGLIAHETMRFFAGETHTTWRVDERGVTAVPATPIHPHCRCTGSHQHMQETAWEEVAL